MEGWLEIWLIPFVSIFFIVDPIAAIPSYLTMTAADSPQKRRVMALKASIWCVAILVLFASLGGVIFKVFGVTLPAFRIAGGIILGLSALEMLRADRPTRGRKEEVEEGVEKEDVAVTPLAIPLLVGRLRRGLARYVWMSFNAGFGQSVGSVIIGIGLLAGAALFMYWQIGSAANGGRYPAGVFSGYAAGIGILAAQALLVRVLERHPEVRRAIEVKE